MHRVSAEDNTTDSLDRIKPGCAGPMIIDLRRRNSPEMGWGALPVCGLAVGVEDGDARNQFRREPPTGEARSEMLALEMRGLGPINTALSRELFASKSLPVCRGDS